MPTKNEEQQQQQPTVKNQLTIAFWTVISMIIYIALGLILCYLKVIFGDMCRASNLNHTTFTDPEDPYPVKEQQTTPSLPYYCKEEGGKPYVKQLFIAEPNFITAYAQYKGETKDGKTVPPTYTENETSQIFKAFFLESSYIMFSVTSILQSIPDWLIILLHPIIWWFAFLGMSIFTWLISSYNIFMYFLKENGIFAKLWIGWLAGFIVWVVAMCWLGAITVPVGVFCGFGQLVVLLSKQNVRVLDPSIEGRLLKPPTTDKYKPYSFSKYFLDMVKTSPIIHLMLLYTAYNIVEKLTMIVSVSFSKMFAYAFLAIIVIVFVWYKGRFTFIPPDKLKENGWTFHIDPIMIPDKIPKIQKAFELDLTKVREMLDRAKKYIPSSTQSVTTAITNGASSVLSKLSNVSQPQTQNVVPAKIVSPTSPPTSTSISTSSSAPTP